MIRGALVPNSYCEGYSLSMTACMALNFPRRRMPGLIIIDDIYTQSLAPFPPSNESGK
jgi:hypothetical protein